MEVPSWSQLVAAALGGGLTVKLLDIAYQEIRSRFSQRRTARKLVDDHLDPILKAADEIVGKLRSLAEEDFASLRRSAVRTEETVVADHKTLVLLYLFASFWARIELLKRDAIGGSLQKHPKGKLLKQFLDCIESRRVRLVDRGVQRAVGETLLDTVRTPASTIYFIEFADRVQDQRVWQWYRPLHRTVTRFQHTQDRQRVLQYGAVLHALIDTLDPKHDVTGQRPSWPNKLTRRTVRALQFRIFGRYLGFVRTKRKYFLEQRIEKAPRGILAFRRKLYIRWGAFSRITRDVMRAVYASRTVGSNERNPSKVRAD